MKLQLEPSKHSIFIDVYFQFSSRFSPTSDNMNQNVNYFRKKQDQGLENNW